MSLGSGLYRSYSNDSAIYTYDKDSGNVLLVGPIKTVAASELDLTSKGKEKNGDRYKRHLDSYKKMDFFPKILDIKNRFQNFYYQDLAEFAKVTLKPGTPDEVLEVSVCSNNNFCCNLSYQYTGSEIYQFMVFDGKSFIINGKHKIAVQQCGIVWCKTSDYETCAHVELGLPKSDFFGPFEISSSSFKSDLVFPIGLHRNLSLITNEKVIFVNKDTFFSIKAEAPVKNTLSVALFGRRFKEDDIYGRKDN